MPPRHSYDINKAELFDGHLVTPHLYPYPTTNCQVLKLEVDTQSAEKKESMQEKAMRAMLDKLQSDESGQQKRFIAYKTRGMRPNISRGQRPW